MTYTITVTQRQLAAIYDGLQTEIARLHDLHSPTKTIDSTDLINRLAEIGDKSASDHLQDCLEAVGIVDAALAT